MLIDKLMKLSNKNNNIVHLSYLKKWESFAYIILFFKNSDFSPLLEIPFPNYFKTNFFNVNRFG